MIRQVYIADWFFESRYGTYIVVYGAGEAGAWGGFRRLYWIIVRTRTDGTLSSLSIVPGTDGVFASIRSWYGPAENISEPLALAAAKKSDVHVTRLLAPTYRTASVLLVQTAYG